MTINLPTQVSFILEELNKHGYESFIVGGCVRDSLMQKTPHDFDITTDATPNQIKKIFKKTFDTGIEHGTVTVCIDKINFEVTTYRIDGEYTDGRHPDEVTFTKKIEEDLSRRDFTINAIAYNPKDGFVDFFDGQNDIAKKLIRGVGNPAKRFQEDGLRMLRAVRFSVQLDFDIDLATWEALKENSQLIKNISYERITAELVKIILSDNIARFSAVWQSGLLELVINNSHSYMENHSKKIIAYLGNCKKNVALRFALIMQYLPVEKVDNILKVLKFDNKTRKEICILVKHLNDIYEDDFYSIRKAMSSIGIDNFENLFYLKQCMDIPVDNILEKVSQIIENKDCLSLKELKINGDDLKSLGIKGKYIGEVLNTLLDYVLEQPDKNELVFLIDKTKIYCPSIKG